MKKHFLHFILSLALMMGAISASAQTTWTVENLSGSTFTISRSGDISNAVTVNYRTVSLSAFAGQHFTAVNGSLNFGANEPSRTVTVTESNPGAEAYWFQTDSKRSYRFEVLDQGGFELAHYDRSYTTGTKVPSSGIFETKDVTIQTAEYSADDRGYDNNGYKSVLSSNYFDNAAPQPYLQTIGAELRMTLSFQAKEEDDAYEYLQILFDNTSTCDDRSGASNGDPGTPTRSIYMAGFEMNSGSTDVTYRNYSFPVTSAGNNASAPNPWGHGANWPLTMQKFNTMTGMNFRASDGRLVLPTNFNSLVLRLNASGSSGSDKWWAKNVVAHIQAVDEHYPTLLNNSIAGIAVNGGRHSKGNIFYISVPFSEIVHISGNYRQLNTSWGTMTYLSGDYTNVITFIGTINAEPGTVLSITGINNCNFNDLAGKYYQGNNNSFNKTFNGVTVEASYNYPISYTLNSGVLPSGYPTTYTYDAATSIMNPTRTGYDFTGWTGSNGNTQQTNVTIPIHSHGAKSYTAHWTPTTYNLTYDLAGGSASNPANYNIETATFTLNNPTRTGYTFAGWTGTDLSEPTMTVTIAQGSMGDRSYTATWNTITYNISYDLAGGSVATANPTTYNIETATFTLNNPTRTGYTFAGWTGTGLNGPTMTVTIAQGSIGDRSYTATWTPIIYNLTYDLAGGSVATANPTTYHIETATFTLNNPTRTGYTFAGWTGTDLNGPTMNVTIAQGSIGDRSYTATWNTITYNISYDLAGGSVATANPTTYNIETATFTLNNPTREGYTFAGWTGTGLNEATMTVTIAQGSIGDRSYTATWTPIIYNLTYDLAGGSVATANPTTYNIETATFTLNNPTREGYTFAGWTGTDLDEPTMTVTIAQGSIGDREYTATWNTNTYNITYNLAGGSVATANPTTYTVETPNITLNNPTREGYTFAGWTGTDLDEPTMTVTIAQGSIGDRSYTATWNTITYNISYDLAGGSVTTANPTTYNIETATFTLNNPTREGYTFAGWTGTGLNEATMTVTIAQGSIGDRSYTATWNTITYNLTYDLAGGSVATANPTTYNIETATFTLNNPTREHFTFAGWEGAGLSEPTTTVTIEQGSTGDRKYYANWTPNFSEFWDGDGSQEHPYIITDTIGLNMLATLVNEGYDLGDGKRYFELGADIQYDNTVDNNYKSVGNAEGGDHAFSDIFDGKGHTISGIRVSSSRIVQGVFGWSFGGTVKNVILTDAIFSVSGYYAGGLVGYNQGTVENCLVIDVTVSGDTYQGAVVGVNEGGTVTNSYYRNCTVGNSSGQTNCYTVSGGTNVNVVFNSYAYGILYNGTLYAPEGTDVSLNLTYTGDVPQGYAPIFLSDNAYYPLNGTSNPYLLRTTNEDITINVELGLADVAYLDANGVQQTCPVARRITSDNSEEYVLYNGQWFVVDDNVTINEGIYFEDDAHLIIKDGATLTTQEIGGRYSLSIYAQSGGDDMGCINAMVYAEGLIINGGIINANQVDGSGLHSNRGDLVITSGRITANIIEADYEEHKGIANIILSWRNATDFITSAGYSCEKGNVKVWTGRIITDGNNIYWGTLTNDQVTAIAGQTLVPFQATWEGSGTAEDPYIITTPDELDMLAFMVNIGNTYQNTYFELGNDIAYTHTSDWDDTSSDENNYTAIGSLNYCAFLGVFDGKGHAISGIRIYSNEGKQGLFGVTFNAVIRNITLTDTRITTVNEANVGGIVGVNQGTVENCHVTNTVNIHNVPVQVGGIVGLNTTDAIVRGCTSSVRLTIDNENYHGSYGGIVGSLGSGCTIEDCLAIDVINECTNSSGPIVGSNNGTVTNSYYRNCTVGSESNMSNAYIVSHADNVTVAVNSYNLGIEYDGTLYAPENAVLSLNLGFTGDPQEFGGYMASAGTLTGTENPYSLTMPAEDVHISAKMSIPYIDADGQTAYCQYYTILNGSTNYSSYSEDGVEAWYVVDHNVTYSDGLYFNGPTNLILVDGATLTLNDETEGNGYMMCFGRLTIYVQSEGTGAITAVNSGIDVDGDLIIHGGHITLSSDFGEAYLYSDGDMTINGGAISIENSDYSCIYTYGLLTINGGALNAVVTGEDNSNDVIFSDEDVVINGGNITVTNQGYGRGIVGDNVTINGGCVKVYIAHEDESPGIVAVFYFGVITLGWTDPENDCILSEGGYDATQLSIATGQAFTDGEGNYYVGTYYWPEFPDLAGKTLRPFTNLDETFHITYVTNGGTLPDGYPTTYTFGETVVLPVPTKEDNAFAGWFDNAEFEGSPVTEIVEGTTLGDKTFYAKWMPAKTWVEYLDADGQPQTVYATVLYGIETELPGGVYTIVDDDVYFDKLTFTGNTTIILPDYKRLNVEAWGKGTNDDENGLFVNGDLTIYGQEFGDGLLNSFNVQVSGDVAIYGGHLDIGILSANNGSGTITLSWTGWDSSIRVGVYLGKVVLAKAFIDDDDNIHEAGTVADVTTINGQWLYPFITETEVSYLDENGVLQTVTATLLYGGEEAEYPGGVYTVVSDLFSTSYTYYDRLHFTDDATIIIPDWCSFGVAATKEDNEYWLHVDGDLTIYGQEYGNGQCLFSNVTVNGHVNVYGGEVVLYNISANAINLSWTSIQNEHMVNPTQGTTVNLLKDFMYYDDDNNRHVINAQQNVDITTIAERYLKPYAETINVSYIDENGDTHTENATVLFGDETNLDGGTYTIMNGISFSHALSFSGDTKLIVPDDTYFYGYTQDFSFFEGEVINVNVSGDLAIYGQENRSGTVLYINASVSGAVTVSNVSVIYSFINSESDILIAGGEHEYGQLSANGTITLGYLTFNDQIFCYDYEGTVAIRESLTMINDGNGKTYTGMLTAEEVAEIENNYLYPYLTPINLEVAGYGESTESDHWVFIASPIAGSIYADNVTNLIGGMTPSGQYDYDLYRFNQSADKEWENYQQHNTMSDPFLLENGKGYLYANKYDVTLKFGGAVYLPASKEVALDYDANARLAGWNLVGNPFNAPATLDKSYYKMNSEGTGIVAEAVSGNTTIAAFTGVMVQANGEDETVLFTKSNAKGQQETGFGTLQIALTQAGKRGTALLDNAIVSFNEGDELGKFYFGTQDANIYLPQDHEEYAIVSVGTDVARNVSTEIPINFKAHKNGEYTLTVNPEGVNLAYLHLIDNLTGADVDLLATKGGDAKHGDAKYTFTAKTTDYESRFKLVFVANSEDGSSTGSEAFAFISNGNIIITDVETYHGAILQIVDVTGRIIRNVELSQSGGRIKTAGMAPGVYVLRLIKGNETKTQKIVIP